jgi:hypothetical protein
MGVIDIQQYELREDIDELESKLKRRDAKLRQADLQLAEYKNMLNQALEANSKFTHLILLIFIIDQSSEEKISQSQRNAIFCEELYK